MYQKNQSYFWASGGAARPFFGTKIRDFPILNTKKLDEPYLSNRLELRKI